MAMALGVTASAYAANPFSDVPAGHWAYDSVAKLATAGVVDGYADGAFDGDKLMTRYEMAQIVAKAMAKGADCDKLAAEFADELDNLGVRVAKLEKGADAVTIAGQARFSYKTHDGKADEAGLRTRLWVNGQINDDWSYTGMLESTQDIKNEKGDDTIELKRVYVEGKVGGVYVLGGKWNEFFYNANILDAWTEGAKFTYGKDVKVSAIAANNINGDDTFLGSDLYAINVATKVGAIDVAANYFKAGKVAYALNGKEIYNINLGLDVAKDFRLSYEYMWADENYAKKAVGWNISKDGYWARLDYKGADASVPGSYGVHAQVFDQPRNVWLSPTTDATTFADGYEGWGVGFDYTLAKNIQLCVNYYDTEAIKLKGEGQSDEVLFTELYMFF